MGLAEAMVHGVPTAMVRLMALTALWGRELEKRQISAVEYFAGRQSITRALRAAGYAAVAFELKLGESMDFMSLPGYILAVALALRCRPGALAWLAPVCRHSAAGRMF